MPLTGDEKQSLQPSLARHRDVVRWKLDGLDDGQLRRPMTPFGTNLLDPVEHLASVEYEWCETFGRETEVPPFDEDDPDTDLRVEPHESTADIPAFYERVAPPPTG